MGSLLGALVAALAWVLTLVVMAIDISLFGVSHSYITNQCSLECCAMLMDDKGHQKSRQQPPRLARILLNRYVDLPRGYGVVIPRHVHRAVHMLQCEKGQEVEYVWSEDEQ